MVCTRVTLPRQNQGLALTSSTAQRNSRRAGAPPDEFVHRVNHKSSA